MVLSSLDEAVEAAGLVARYYTRQGHLRGACYYNGLCYPLEETERRFRETSDYIEDAERLAGGMTANPQRPDIVWMEGLLTLFDVAFPHKPDHPRRMGFSQGKQVVGLYIVEMLLKYALDYAGSSHGQHHDLQDLFRKLPRQRKRAVERRYREILNSEQDWAWDVAETADSFLHYLGGNAITDTRYFWEPGRSHLAEHASIMIAPGMLRPLIYALFIELHNYPTQPIVKRYETTFVPLAKCLEEDQAKLDAEKLAASITTTALTGDACGFASEGGKAILM